MLSISLPKKGGHTGASNESEGLFQIYQEAHNQVKTKQKALMAKELITGEDNTRATL